MAPLVSFGLCADVQAADRPSVEGNEGRLLRYDEATHLLALAIDDWQESTALSPLSFVLNLGDIVDGRESEEATRADLDGVVAQFSRLGLDVLHVLGNHCVKFIPRVGALTALGFPRADEGVAYYARALCAGWRLIVLDTTDLSTHGGWDEGSEQQTAALAYQKAHAGAERMQRWNGGVGTAQLAWLRSELAEARTSRCRVIVSSHHCLAPGACRETHRAWNGDEVCEVLHNSGLVALALAGHDHVGGYASVRGVAHVTLQAILEAPVDGNAFGVLSIHHDRIEICGYGTSVTSRSLPLPPCPWDDGSGKVGAVDVSERDVSPATPAAPAAAADVIEDAAVGAEVAWLLDSECAMAVSLARELLRRVSGEMEMAAQPSARSMTLRGGNEADGMLLAAVVGSTSLHALRVQLDAFPKWNKGEGYSGMLLGGQRATLSVPPLLHVRNRVVQALAASGGDHSTATAARASVNNTLLMLSDAVRTLSVSPMPTAPSAIAASLTAMMQPPVPPGVLVDVQITSSPPRIVFSAYLMGANDGGVADARHVTVEPDELGERLAALSRAQCAMRGLLAKIDAVEGLVGN